MKGKIKNINPALPALMLGILLFGILCELVGVWFVKDKLIYLVSVALGGSIAELMAFHMAWTIKKAVDFENESAEKMVLKHNMIRYALLVIAFGIILITGIVNPLYTFLGVMGLKVGAYLQPFTHKLLTKNKDS